LVFSRHELARNLGMLMATRLTLWVLSPLMMAVLAGCGAAPDSNAPRGSTQPATKAPSGAGSGTASPAASPTGSDGRAEGHEHTAPHGGALVEFGEEFAHLEIVLAASTGTLTAYVLDGEAEQAVRLAQPSIEIVVMKEGAPLTLALQPVANELTGERAGETSQFSVTSSDLRQLVRFEGRIQRVDIRGREFRDLAFRFPEGSEH
jgi:hypothetical protein